MNQASLELAPVYTLDPRLLIFPGSFGGQRCFLAEVDAGQPPLMMKSPRMGEALLGLKDNFVRHEATGALVTLGVHPEVAEAAFELLVASDVIREVAELAKAMPQLGKWREWGWMEALIYHEGTRDYPFSADGHGRRL